MPTKDVTPCQPTPCTATYANGSSATTGGTGSATQHTTTLTEHTQHRRTNE